MSLNGSRVVVTAGAAGIGLGIARSFLAQGASVCICDIDSVAISAAVDSLPDVIAVPADIRDELQVRQVVKRVVDEWGGIDVLVNNAGVAGPSVALDETALEAWRATFAVNVEGAFLMMREVVPHMLARRSGCITNISTCSTRTGIPRRSAYVASKWALEGLTFNAARELGPQGIRVNAIRPGFMNTPRIDRAMQQASQATGRPVAEIEQDILRFIAMRAKVEPEEVGDLCVFLASEGARHITGQIIGVDGYVEWEG